MLVQIEGLSGPARLPDLVVDAVRLLIFFSTAHLTEIASLEIKQMKLFNFLWSRLFLLL
jgi:hypothetical protein